MNGRRQGEVHSPAQVGLRRTSLVLAAAIVVNNVHVPQRVAAGKDLGQLDRFSLDWLAAAVALEAASLRAYAMLAVSSSATALRVRGLCRPCPACEHRGQQRPRLPPADCTAGA